MFPLASYIHAADKAVPKSASGRPFRSRSGGFSLMELLIVVGIGLTIVAIGMPLFMQGLYNIRLKSAASNLSGLMQQARIQAARQNRIYTIAYNPPTSGTTQQACIDANFNNACDPGEIVINFSRSVSMSTTGAPTGTGAPPAYVLVGDPSTTNYTNTTTLGYSNRGLPCAYTTSTGACPTPAPGYFVYYIQDARVGSTGWAGVVVTRSGRTKPIVWDGASWD